MNRFVVICEDRADFRTATLLADRVLQEEVDWLRDQDLGDFREWVGLDDAHEFVKWAGLRAAFEERGIRPARIYGHFGGGDTGAPDAWAARFALLALASLPEPPAGVLLIRDADAQPTRARGLKQARDSLGTASPFVVVIGVADRTREAWILAGFRPVSKSEEEQLARLTQSLGFDPTRDPRRLQGHDDARDPKTVLAALVQQAEREEVCLASLDLRGPLPSVGLAEYLEEVRSRLVPIIGG